jgi:DNA helicase-2/ATP-dependent DNA helicase PcrA
MEENLFPNAMSMNSQRELEEERRLFYVAITRARKYCFLSCAKMRFRYGSMDFCEPSRFLKEIDKRFIRMEMKSEPKGSDRGFGGTSSRFAETTANKRSGLSAVGPAMPVAPRRLRPMPSNNDVKTEGESHQSLHTPNGVIRVGQHVVHDRFGEGSVLALEGTNEMVKARIRFVNMGEKTLLLKFAKLKFLD